MLTSIGYNEINQCISVYIYIYIYVYIYICLYIYMSIYIYYTYLNCLTSVRLGHRPVPGCSRTSCSDSCWRGQLSTDRERSEWCKAFKEYVRLIEIYRNLSKSCKFMNNLCQFSTLKSLHMCAIFVLYNMFRETRSLKKSPVKASKRLEGLRGGSTWKSREWIFKNSACFFLTSVCCFSRFPSQNWAQVSARITVGSRCQVSSGSAMRIT